MKIQNVGKWNDEMFSKHPTPYTGFAGLVEKIRIRTILADANIGPKDKVLEIGCEAGNLITSINTSDKLTGFDISKEALGNAKKLARKLGKKIKFVQGDATKKLPFKKGEFDVIICSETLEHVLDPAKAIDRIWEIAGKKSRVIITVPNEKPKLVVKKLLKKFRIMDLVMPGIEDKQSEWHIHAFSKPMILKLLKKNFKIERVGSILGLHVIVSARPK